MAFRFRLEKVLAFRKSNEELARKNYLEIKAELEDQQNILKSYYDQIELAQAERHKLILKGGNSSESLSQIHNYIKGMEIKIDRQKIVIKNQLIKVEESQLVLQRTSIECKMIEKLKENQKEEFRQLNKKKEEKILSEMTNARFNLRKKNESEF